MHWDCESPGSRLGTRSALRSSPLQLQCSRQSLEATHAKHVSLSQAWMQTCRGYLDRKTFHSYPLTHAFGASRTCFLYIVMWPPTNPRTERLRTASKGILTCKSPQYHRSTAVSIQYYCSRPVSRPSICQKYHRGVHDMEGHSGQNVLKAEKLLEEGSKRDKCKYSGALYDHAGPIEEHLEDVTKLAGRGQGSVSLDTHHPRMAGSY